MMHYYLPNHRVTDHASKARAEWHLNDLIPLPLSHYQHAHLQCVRYWLLVYVEAGEM